MSLSTLQIDDTVFRDRLNALAMHVGDAGKVLKQEAKMLMREIIARTPPQGGTSRVSRYETIDVNARRQGELAIAKDLKSVFEVMSDANYAKWLNIARLKRLQRSKSGARFKFNYIMPSGTTDRTKAIVDVELYGETLEQMREHHQSLRSPSTGRTLQKFRNRRDPLGRNKRIEIMYVSQSMYDKYRAQVWKYVGKQKGGWGVGAQLLGIRLPGWIMRHANGVNGYVLSNLDDKTSPSITIGNKTPGVIRNCERIVNYALQNRARFMERNLARLIKYGPGKNGSSGYAS